VSVITPDPDSVTVSTLLDATWRMTAAEAARTDALDRKAATVATFASLIAALTATVGLGFVDAVKEWWALGLFVGGLVMLVGALGCAVRMLWPREYATLGTSYVRRFPTWGEILKPPGQVQGELMRTLVEVVNREREVNDRKVVWLRWGLALLVIGLVVIGIEGAIVGIQEVRG